MASEGPKDLLGRKIELQERVVVLATVEKRPTIKVGTITHLTQKTVQVTWDAETAKFISDENGYVNKIFLMPVITPAKPDEWKDAIGQGIHVDDQVIIRDVDDYGSVKGFRFAGKVTGFTAKRVKTVINEQSLNLRADCIIVCPQNVEFDRLIKERADYEKSAQEQEEARIAAEAAMEPIRIDSKDGIAPVKSGSAKTSAVMNQIGATCHGYYCVRVYQDYKYKGVKVRIELSGYIDEMHADITPSKTDVFLPNSAQRVILSDPIENGPFAEAYRALLPVYEGLVNKVDDR